MSGGGGRFVNDCAARTKSLCYPDPVHTPRPQALSRCRQKENSFCLMGLDYVQLKRECASISPGCNIPGGHAAVVHRVGGYSIWHFVVSPCNSEQRRHSAWRGERARIYPKH